MRESSLIRIGVIGATGSVGTSVLDICRRFPERFRVIALAARENVGAMARLVQEFEPEMVTLQSLEASDRLRTQLGGRPGLSIHGGSAGLQEMVNLPELDHVVFAASGTDTLPALLTALDRDLDVSLANKESLVVGGAWVMPRVRRPDQLRPVDSEHSAVWECLRGEFSSELARIGLTASGGPFRDFSVEQLSTVTPAMALKHPVWAMGSKITIDSATLMNKGLEILEAMHLFRLPMDRIDAVVHPASLVHGYAVFRDGTLKMALSRPDMRLPAALALAYPERLPVFDPGWPPEGVDRWTLEFSRIDEKRFPCLALARMAGEKMGPYPALLVGSDEVAVQAFLNGQIGFTGIPALIEDVMAACTESEPCSLEDAICLIRWGREKARDLLRARG